MKKPQKFFIAQVGKTYGLHGDLKLHLHTDFPEQFQIGESFDSSSGRLEISRINLDRSIVAFRGYDGVDYAKKLTNTKIYASLEETKDRCQLNEGEHFWFELDECNIIENGELLGKVTEIQRLADVDYLFIQTDKSLLDSGFAKSFLIPNISRYIVSVNIDNKTIDVVDAKEILEAS
ncbi:MAG TPA: 16S rRNA processing protein RimM [Campylobacterales bacterium]|nr:16S rRNA processing protein RimM [Campylobacterales bacterium]